MIGVALDWGPHGIRAAKILIDGWAWLYVQCPRCALLKLDPGTGKPGVSALTRDLQCACAPERPIHVVTPAGIP